MTLRKWVGIILAGLPVAMALMVIPVVKHMQAMDAQVTAWQQRHADAAKRSRR